MQERALACGVRSRQCGEGVGESARGGGERLGQLRESMICNRLYVPLMLLVLLMLLMLLLLLLMLLLSALVFLLTLKTWRQRMV